MTKYAQDILDAAKDIQDAGTLVVYNSISRTKDAVTPWKNDTVTSTVYNVYVVVTKSSNKPILSVVTSSSVTLDAKDLGTPIYDYELLLAGNAPFIPASDDTVILGGLQYKVVEFEIIQPDLVPIMYILKVRK